MEKRKQNLSEDEIRENEREQQFEGESHEGFRHRGANEQRKIFGLDKETRAMVKEIFKPSDKKQLDRIEDKQDRIENKQDRLNRKVNRILDLLERAGLQRQAVAFRFQIATPAGQIILKENNFYMAFRKNQSFTVTLKPVDVNGDATTLDGDPVWSSSDETVCSVTPNPDNPLEAQCQTFDVLGDAIIKATGDGDLDAGEGEVTSIEGSGLVSVLGNDAVGIELEFGTPATPEP